MEEARNDPDLQKDIEEEVSNYGALKTPLKIDIIDDNVQIQLCFMNANSALKAYNAMQGRCFDDKTIKATLL